MYVYIHIYIRSKLLNVTFIGLIKDRICKYDKCIIIICSPLNAIYIDLYWRIIRQFGQ
jgi:hypothetical protein